MKTQILTLVIGFFVCSQAFALPRPSPKFSPVATPKTDIELSADLKMSSVQAVDVTWEFQTLEHVALHIKAGKQVKKGDMKFFRRLVAKYNVPTKLRGKSGRKLLLAQARTVLSKQEKLIRNHMSNLAIVMTRCRVAMRHSADKDFQDCFKSTWTRLSASQEFVNDITALQKKLR